MKRLLSLALGVVCLSIGIAACDKEPKAAEANKMTNGDLERAIEASINADPTFAAYRISVNADVDKNTATLSGTVPTEAARTRVVEMAKTGRPNLVVTDKIDMVTLRGHVNSKEDRAKLEEIAKNTDGVKSVRNLLTIKAK